MSTPIFVHVLSTGAIWSSNDINFTPAGTILATFRVNSDARSQLLGTVSGNSGSYATSGHTGKFGTEKT